MKLITTTLVFLALAFGANVCVAGISGTLAEQKERARRVVPSEPTPSPEEAKPSVPRIEASKESSTTPAAPTVKKDEAPGERTESDPKANQDLPDSLAALRNQIEAAENGPERIRLQLKLSEQLVARGQKTEATRELRAIIDNDVFDPQGYYNVGNALARLGDSDDAIKAYRKAIDQRKGTYSRALNNLGVLLLREGRWDEAYEALLSALRLESFRYAEASYNLGRLYSARGENDIAIREWRRALKVDPEHKAAAQALSLAASRPGIVVKRSESEKAPSLPRSVSNRTPVPPAERRPEKSPAPPNFSTAKALTLDAVSYDFFQRARNLRERGKLEGAVENFRSVLSRSHGYFPPANLELSYSLIALKRPDEALGYLLPVANRDGARFPIAYQFIARSYESKGDLALAEEWFAKAASAFKSTTNPFLLDLSRIRERRGNFKGALEAFEEYVSAMEQQGLKPTWSDERLAALRRKAAVN
ncbi:MAG: tetratricopeptide repeat protein [Pyrinomonadaceae bacterium]